LLLPLPLPLPFLLPVACCLFYAVILNEVKDGGLKVQVQPARF
jgi:hypothetical protein